MKSLVRVSLASGGTVSNARFYVGGAPGFDGYWTFVVLKNGESTGLTCDIFRFDTSCLGVCDVCSRR